jgi:hypothetical protein
LFTAQAAEEDTTELTTDSPNEQNNFEDWNIFGIMEANQDFDNQMKLGRGPRGRGRSRHRGSIGKYELSEDYTDSVNSILDSDTDIQDLVSQGYNVTSINPKIKNVIEADGTMVTKASTAMVRLEHGEDGFATVSVDLEQAVVTRIVIITRTVIDKTTA